MKTNPFLDTWLFFLGQQPDQVNLGILRLFPSILLTVLLISGVAIAARNWADDPGQRTGGNVATWLARTLVGSMWLQGSLWKLPIGTENGLFYWTKQMVTDSAFDWHRELVDKVLLPVFLVVDPLVFMTEIAFAVSLILGFGVRLVGIVGVLFVLNLWIGLYRNGAEWPWNYIFLAIVMGGFSLHAAGRALGLDAMLQRRRLEGWGRPGLAERLVAVAT
ncbi:MAG: DoxX family protein [Methylobacteriaceae bacterium]|nr:DoxX family protein [Methylobacteriaceae bacterium]